GGGNTAGGTDGGAAGCGPYPLSELCDPEPASCPASPEDVPLNLCHIENVERFASSCDGVVVRRGDGLITTTLSFDAVGSLTGVVIKGDVPDTCEDGGQSSTVAYGDNCEPDGPAEDLCLGAGGTGGAGGETGVGGAPQ
ncbi:MAG TPA: hypothetical protein VEX18_00400, partial [Polyangiaceae bacterium]|nr:hypothetical protein [Polyangiaceae bacterium]